MTQNKVQKAAIRRRMAETGESYVVARRTVLEDAVLQGAPTSGPLTPEEQYAREAAAEGVSPGEIDARTLVYRLEAAAEQAQQDAEVARVRADQAEQEAETTEERAGRAEEAAEAAEEWAEPAERQLLRDRAGQLLEAAERARLEAEHAEEAAVAAEERAELAADAATEATEDEARLAEPSWARAPGGGFQVTTRSGPWSGDQDFMPPVPPTPPASPAPPVPPAPPGAFHHAVMTQHGMWAGDEGRAGSGRALS